MADPPAAAARHPHLASPVGDGRVRVDMHLHTMWSGDATTTPDELAAAVEEARLDVVCITDHGTTNGAVELSDRLGCRVVVGQEVRTWAGEIIGLFLRERIPAGLRPEEVCVAIAAQGGLVYIPHPYDPMRACLREDILFGLVQDGLVDAVEVLNAKTSLSHLNARARSLATEHGLAAGAGSDAHEPTALGAAYVAVDDFDGSDPQSFLAALRSPSAVVAGHHYDAPRAWKARIVPSTRAT